MDNTSSDESLEEKIEYIDNSTEETKPLTGFAYFIAWIRLFPVTGLCIIISIILFLLVNYSITFENIYYPDYLREYVSSVENSNLSDGPAKGADKEYLAYLKYGAIMDGPAQVLLWQGQLWRLLVNIFHHGGVLHIFFNLYAIYFLGSFAEKFMGKKAYISFILLCSIGQQIACQLTFEPGAIGISGVVFGIFGILMIVKNQDESIKRFMTPGLIKSMIVQIFIFMALTYFNVLNIANVGHVFGLLYGFFFAFIFYRKPNIINKIIFVIINLAMIPGLYYIYQPVNNPDWQKWQNSHKQIYFENTSDFKIVKIFFENKQLKNFKLYNG